MEIEYLDPIDNSKDSVVSIETVNVDKEIAEIDSIIAKLEEKKKELIEQLKNMGYEKKEAPQEVIEVEPAKVILLPDKSKELETMLVNEETGKYNSMGGK